MPKFSVSVPHKLGQEEAMSRIKGLVADLKEQYGDQVSDVKEEWSDNQGEFSLKLRGFRLSGSVFVKSSSAEVNGTLPFAATPFQGKAKELIAHRAKQLLS